MGDLPLRTPTHRRLGRPLPYQLPNAPHAHPSPELLPLTSRGCPRKVLCCISRNFFRLSTCDGQVAYVLLTRAPVAGWREQALSPAAPRLACVKPVASVHPEPGSNSSLLLSCLFFFSEYCWSTAPKERPTPQKTTPQNPLPDTGQLLLSYKELTKELLSSGAAVAADRILSSCTTLQSIVILSMFSIGLPSF